MKDIKNAPLFKRIFAAILDAAFFVLLFLLTSSFIMTPIVDSTMGLRENVLLGYQYETASHLYVLCQVVSVETGEDKIIEVKDYTEQINPRNESGIRGISTRKEVDHSYLIDHVKYYYLSYKTGVDVVMPNNTASHTYDMVKDHFVDPAYETKNAEGKLPKEIYTLDWFEKDILKIGSEEAIYEVDADHNYVLTAAFKNKYTDPTKSEEENNKNILYEAKKYASDIVYNAQKDLFYTKIIQDINHNVTVANNFAIVTAAVFSMLIVYLLFPMIFANGETLGKLTMKICLVNKLDYRVTKPQVLLRQLLFILMMLVVAFVFDVGMGSLVTVGIGAFIFMMVTLFVPNNRSLHDLAAGTRVIDSKNSVFFKDAESEEKAAQKLKENMEKYRSNKVENKNIIQVGSKIVDEKLKEELEQEDNSDKTE